MSQTRLCYHPPPPTTSQNISTTIHHQPKYIHHHLPPPTTSQNISTTIHHHPPPAKIYPPPPTTSQNISTTIHHHPPTAKIYPTTTNHSPKYIQVRRCFIKKILRYLFKSKWRKTFWLTFSWRRRISYRNQSIDLLHKSMDWFLYDIGYVMKGLTTV